MSPEDGPIDRQGPVVKLPRPRSAHLTGATRTAARGDQLAAWSPSQSWFRRRDQQPRSERLLCAHLPNARMCWNSR